MRTAFKLLIVCLVVVGACSAADQRRVAIVPGTTVHRLKTAKMEGDLTSVMVRDEELELHLAAGELRYGRLLLVFHAPSRRYWWTVQPEGSSRGEIPAGDAFDEGMVAFIAPDRFIVFAASYGQLRLSESTNEAADLDGAEAKALETIGAHVTEIASGWEPTWKAIKLDLPRSFYYDSPAAAMFREPKVVNVAHDANRWSVTLRCQWKEEVVLDADYHVTETRKID